MYDIEENKAKYQSILDAQVNYLRSTDTIILVGSRAVGAVQKFSVTHTNCVDEQVSHIDIERLAFDNISLLEALGVENIDDRFTITVVEKKKIAYNYLGCRVLNVTKIYDTNEPIVIERATISVEKIENMEKKGPAELSFLQSLKK